MSGRSLQCSREHYPKTFLMKGSYLTGRGQQDTQKAKGYFFHAVLGLLGEKCQCLKWQAGLGVLDGTVLPVQAGQRSVVCVKSGGAVEIPRCSGVDLSSELQLRRKKGMPSLPRDEDTPGPLGSGSIFKTPRCCSPPSFIPLTWVPTPHWVVKWSRHLFPTSYLRRRRMLIKTMGSSKQGTLGFSFYRNSVLLSPFNTLLCLLTDSIPGDVDGSDLSCQCSFSCPAKSVWCTPGNNSHWVLCQDSSENFANSSVSLHLSLGVVTDCQTKQISGAAGLYLLWITDVWGGLVQRHPEILQTTDTQVSPIKWCSVYIELT